MAPPGALTRMRGSSLGYSHGRVTFSDKVKVDLTLRVKNPVTRSVTTTDQDTESGGDRLVLKDLDGGPKAGDSRPANRSALYHNHGSGNRVGHRADVVCRGTIGLVAWRTRWT